MDVYLDAKHFGINISQICEQGLRALTALSAQKLPADLCPIITVDGVDYFLDMPQSGAIPVREMKDKAGSAQAHQFVIQTALDRVFGAY